MNIYVILDPENRDDATYAGVGSVEVWASAKPIEDGTSDIADDAKVVNLTELLCMARKALRNPTAAAKLDKMLSKVGF